MRGEQECLDVEICGGGVSLLERNDSVQALSSTGADKDMLCTGIGMQLFSLGGCGAAMQIWCTGIDLCSVESGTVWILGKSDEMVRYVERMEGMSSEQEISQTGTEQLAQNLERDDNEMVVDSTETQISSMPSSSSSRFSYPPHAQHPAVRPGLSNAGVIVSVCLACSLLWSAAYKKRQQLPAGNTTIYETERQCSESKVLPIA